MGIFSGATGVILIVAIVIAAILVLAVIIVSALRGKKEKDEAAEAQYDFWSEYGVKPIADEAAAQQPAEDPAPIAEEIKQEPVPERLSAQIIEEPEEIKQEPAPVIEEIVPEPVVEEIKEEAAAEEVKEEPVAAPQPQPEPQPEPVEEPKKGVEKPDAPKKKVKKPEDWSKYDGDYEGYYYDPEDACYYEGKASASLQKKIDAKRKELDEANAKAGKKVVIKKIAPPFATLKTPKHPRNTPAKVDGFDESVIYGKYVIEHVGKEFFYTLYSNKEIVLYESGNYSTLEYCQRAIVRFKTHCLVGTYTIEEKDGRFSFVIKRKSYTHRGAEHDNFDAAEKNMNDVKYFAQTDIVRIQ